MSMICQMQNPILFVKVGVVANIASRVTWW